MAIGAKIVKSLFRNVKPNESGKVERLSNLYTGKKVNPWWVAGIGGGYLGYSNLKSGMEASTVAPLQLATQRDMQDYGAPDIMMADGVAQHSAPTNLNASGDLVFGLHNIRKGR